MHMKYTHFYLESEFKCKIYQFGKIQWNYTASWHTYAMNYGTVPIVLSCSSLTNARSKAVALCVSDHKHNAYWIFL